MKFATSAAPGGGAPPAPPAGGDQFARDEKSPPALVIQNRFWPRAGTADPKAMDAVAAKKRMTLIRAWEKRDRPATARGRSMGEIMVRALVCSGCVGCSAQEIWTI